MSNRTTLADLRGMDAGQAARLPPAHLALLLEDATALRADAKHVTDLLADALHRRYGVIAAERRQAESKDTGRVRFLDAGFEITADLPKRVEWDRARLDAAIETLRSWGEDPADYVATEIKVAEGRFTAWPPKLQALFQPEGQVLANALHRQRPDGFHPRLFGRLEDGGAVLGLRPEFRVGLFRVIGLAQRIGIAGAAHQRDVLGGQVAMGRGQARLQALQARRLAGEIDFKLRFGRQRSHRHADRALERFGRAFRLHATITLAALSGSSSPKQRW